MKWFLVFVFLNTERPDQISIVHEHDDLISCENHIDLIYDEFHLNHRENITFTISCVQSVEDIKKSKKYIGDYK
jgi:hypothetical protein